MILQELWLDRITGRVCMLISAKALAITGIEDRRYWNWIPTEGSRLDSKTVFSSLFIPIIYLLNVAMIT